MIDTSLIIYSTNSMLPKSITVAPRTRDTSTSLVLHGDGTFNYGQELLTNLIHLAENFSNSTPPTNPISGQKFYNNVDKQLFVYHDIWNEDISSYVGEWMPITIVENSSTLDIVYESDITSKHSDRTLSQYVSKIIPLIGNNSPVEITLIDVQPEIDNQAVTKKYADSILSRPVPYVPKTGTATMTGPLILSDTARTDNDNALVNIKYVDELGTVTIEDEISSPNEYNVITYTDVDRKQADGTADISPWFTMIYFNETIADGLDNKQISLPVTFSTAANIDTTYNYSMAVTCSSVGSNVVLHAVVNSGSSITITRPGTTGELKICGTVYGFRNR